MGIFLVAGMVWYGYGMFVCHMGGMHGQCLSLLDDDNIYYDDDSYGPIVALLEAVWIFSDWPRHRVVCTRLQSTSPLATTYKKAGESGIFSSGNIYIWSGSTGLAWPRNAHSDGDSVSDTILA